MKMELFWYEKFLSSAFFRRRSEKMSTNINLTDIRELFSSKVAAVINIVCFRSHCTVIPGAKSYLVVEAIACTKHRGLAI